MRRLALYVPLLVVYLSGSIVLLDYFTDGLVDGWGQRLAYWVSLLAAFMLLLGLANIVRVHARRINSRRPQAIHSAALLFSALAVIVAGSIDRLQGSQNKAAGWIFQYVYQPLAVTLFSLLAFLLLGVAFRNMRVRSVEAALLALGAIVVLMGQVAFEPFNNLAPFSQWFLDYPVQGLVRGILIGVALGAIATSVRYLLGGDKRYLE